MRIAACLTGFCLVASALSACDQHLVQTQGKNKTDPIDPLTSQRAFNTLPDMPTWVKFVRFPDHDHHHEKSPSTITSIAATKPAATTALITDQLSFKVEGDSAAKHPDRTSGHHHRNEQTQMPTVILAKQDVTERVSSRSPQRNKNACNGQTGYINSEHESWLSSRDPNRWTIQLVSARDDTDVCIDPYLDDINAQSAYRHTLFWQGGLWHIALVGDFSTVDEAMAASSQYPRPWIRQFSDIRRRRCQSVPYMPSDIRHSLEPWCAEIDVAPSRSSTAFLPGSEARTIRYTKSAF